MGEGIVKTNPGSKIARIFTVKGALDSVADLSFSTKYHTPSCTYPILL